MSSRKVKHSCFFFFFNDTATTEIYTLSLHDALLISVVSVGSSAAVPGSPLVSRRDMQGLIRQVIGQERSPAPSSSSVNAGGEIGRAHV